MLHQAAPSTACTGQRLAPASSKETSIEPPSRDCRRGANHAASSPNPQNPRGLKVAARPAPKPSSGVAPSAAAPKPSTAAWAGDGAAWSRLGTVRISDDDSCGSGGGGGGGDTVEGWAGATGSGASTSNATTSVSCSSKDAQLSSP